MEFENNKRTIAMATYMRSEGFMIGTDGENVIWELNGELYYEVLKGPPFMHIFSVIKTLVENGCLESNKDKASPRGIRVSTQDV